MAKQITDLEELFSNELADTDYMLVRDLSARTDKRITVEALKTAFLSALGDLAYKDTVGIEDVDFVFKDSTSQYVLLIGDLQIVAGTTTTANAGTAVTFKKPFDSAPSMVATIRDGNNQTAWITSISASGCTLKQLYTGGALPVGWIAIGKKGAW